MLYRLLIVLMLAVAPLPAAAEVMTFRVLDRSSRVTFKTEAPLETVIGNTSGPSIVGTVKGDPARPQAAAGSIRIDLRAVTTGIDRRDAQMRSKEFLDTDDEAHRYAVFDLKGVEIGGALQPGKEMPAKLMGTLNINGRPVDVTADALVTYVKLTPEQLETQRRYGFSTDNIRVKTRLKTSFTNHGMQVPELLIFKLSNDIQLEADLTLVRL